MYVCMYIFDHMAIEPMEDGLAIFTFTFFFFGMVQKRPKRKASYMLKLRRFFWLSPKAASS